MNIFISLSLLTLPLVLFKNISGISVLFIVDYYSVYISKTEAPLQYIKIDESWVMGVCSHDNKLNLSCLKFHLFCFNMLKIRIHNCILFQLYFNWALKFFNWVSFFPLKAETMFPRQAHLRLYYRYCSKAETQVHLEE